MNQIIKDALTILLDPSVTFCIGILTLVITRNSNISTVARERLDLVYHPLFQEIEPFLYKDVSYKDISPFLQKYYEIEESHSLLINPSLRDMIHSLDEADGVYKKNSRNYNKWTYVCSYICKDYDSLCRKAHLPVRSVAYRINNKQYKNKISFIFAFVWVSLPLIIFYSLLLAIFMPKVLIISYALFAIYLLLQVVDSL